MHRHFATIEATRLVDLATLETARLDDLAKLEAPRLAEVTALEAASLTNLAALDTTRLVDEYLRISRIIENASAREKKISITPPAPATHEINVASNVEHTVDHAHPQDRPLGEIRRR